jgi:hypothetical protein
MILTSAQVRQMAAQAHNTEPHTPEVVLFQRRGRLSCRRRGTGSRRMMLGRRRNSYNPRIRGG